MIKVILLDTATGKALNTIEDIFGCPTLAVTDIYINKTRFKSQYRITAGTTTITSPKTDGAIMLTDIIITTDRAPNTRITVFFDDGTHNITIVDGVPIDAPINLAMPFRGSWTGWKNAALKMTTVGNLKANVAVGYIKMPKGIEYEEWTKMR